MGKGKKAYRCMTPYGFSVAEGLTKKEAQKFKKMYEKKYGTPVQLQELKNARVF